MSLPFTQVDAFTGRAFAGNPAAVFVLPAPRPEPWMQLVAREMNLSETAFLWPQEGAHRLRWFTPKAEVPLCGHATLASAFVLFESGAIAANDTARFLTASGELRARRRGSRIELDFPAVPSEPIEAPTGLVGALGVTPLEVFRSGNTLTALLADEATVRALDPDLRAIARLCPHAAVITAVSSGPHDFVSRFFAPAIGVDEDPVTGSVHCALGPLWRERIGKDVLQAFQASTRGGELEIAFEADRVLLRGEAVIVLRGELLVE